MNTTFPPGMPVASSQLADKQLLVVDDDKALLLAITKVLRHEGAQVRAARNVKEAMAALEEADGGVDLVITDIRMPGASGELLLNAVKASWPGVAVLVMTAFATDALRKACAAQGAAGLLEKPIDTPALVKEIGRALNGTRQVTHH